MYLFFGFQGHRVNSAHEVGLCAYIKISFVLDKVHSCIISCLCWPKTRPKTIMSLLQVLNNCVFDREVFWSNHHRYFWCGQNILFKTQNLTHIQISPLFDSYLESENVRRTEQGRSCMGQASPVCQTQTPQFDSSPSFVRKSHCARIDCCRSPDHLLCENDASRPCRQTSGWI